MEENSLVHEITKEDALATESLFKALADTEKPPVLQLLDINKKPIGAIYFNYLEYNKIMVSTTDTSEKYYLFMNGLGIYFSFWEKIG